MLIYRDILDSLKAEDLDGWGVLNHTLDSLRITHKLRIRYAGNLGSTLVDISVSSKSKRK